MWQTRDQTQHAEGLSLAVAVAGANVHDTHLDAGYTELAIVVATLGYIAYVRPLGEDTANAHSLGTTKTRVAVWLCTSIPDAIACALGEAHGNLSRFRSPHLLARLLAAMRQHTGCSLFRISS
jgi:hypothetical protein